MSHELPPPGPLPTPGFKYHYKHFDPEHEVPDAVQGAELRAYAYLVLPALGHYTEDDGPDDHYRVEYLPLYPWAPVYQMTRRLNRLIKDHRPLSMFAGEIEKPWYTGPRFADIEDRETIEELTKYFQEMYGKYIPII